MSNILELQLVVDDKGSIIVKRAAGNVKEGLEKIEDSAQKLSTALTRLQNLYDRLTGSLKQVYHAAAGLAMPLIALNMVFSKAMEIVNKVKDTFWSLVESAARVGDQMAKMAVRTGMSTQVLSALRISADLAGTSIEELSIYIRMMQNNATAAAMGVGESKRAFEMLGISGRTSTGSMKSADDLFFEVADKLGRMKDATARTSLAMDIFGRSGAQLIPLLGEIAGRKKAVIEQAERLGIVLGEKTTRRAEEFQDALTMLKHATEAVRMALGNALIPVLMPVIESMTESAVAVRQWVEANKELIQMNVASWIGSTIDAMNTVIPIVARIADLIRGVAEGWAYLFGFGKSAAALEFDVRQRLQLGLTSPGAVRERLPAVQSLLSARRAELADIENRFPDIRLRRELEEFGVAGPSPEEVMGGVAERINELRDSIEHLTHEETALTNVQTALDNGLLDLGKGARSTQGAFEGLIPVVKKAGDVIKEAQPDKDLLEGWLKFRSPGMSGVPKALEDIREQSVEVARAQAEQNFELEEYIKTWREKQTLREIEQMALLAETTGEAAAEYKNLNFEVRQSVNIFAAMFDLLGGLSNLMSQLGISIGGEVQRFLGSISAFRQLTTAIGQIRRAGAGGILEFLGPRGPGQGGAGEYREALGLD